MFVFLKCLEVRENKRCDRNDKSTLAKTILPVMDPKLPLSALQWWSVDIRRFVVGLFSFSRMWSQAKQCMSASLTDSALPCVAKWLQTDTNYFRIIDGVTDTDLNYFRFNYGATDTDLAFINSIMNSR